MGIKMIRSIVTNKEKLALISPEIHDVYKAKDIIAELKETAAHYQKKPIGCAGLAANQIGELARIFVIWFDGGWFPVVNPEIYLIPGKSRYEHEGCLSRPGVNVKLQRHKKIRLSYWDGKGLDYRVRVENRRFTGFNARVIQHEFDHLNGVTI